MPTARRAVVVRDALTLAVVTLAAAAARFAFLDRTPPGLHVDEAFNILDARAVIDGWRPLFLPANAGRDVLYTYLQAPLLALFGDRLTVARSASALLGTATVPLAWWMVWTIGSRSDAEARRTRRTRRTALTAAALLAALLWHLHFSRFGIRAILLPALVAALLARWWTAATADEPHARRRAAFDTGIVLGLAAYAHPAGRALVALPAAHALWQGVRRRDAAVGRPLAVAAAVGAVIALPLIVQWLAHPWQATGHAVEVSILGGGLAAVADNAVRVAGLFNVAGDTAMWRNVPGRPAFDLVSGAAFLVGTAIAIRNAWRGHDAAMLALVALVVLTLPSVLTDGAPNFSRAIGVLPVAVWLAAVGAVAIGDGIDKGIDKGIGAGIGARTGDGMGLGTAAGGPDAVARRGVSPTPLARLAAWAPVVIPALVVVIAAASTARAYRAWALDPAARIAFDADIAALARWVDGLPAEPAVFTSPLTADHATYRAAAARPARGVDARHGLVATVPAGATGRGEARYVDVDRLPWSAAQAAALRGWSEVGLPNIRLAVRVGTVSAAPADVGALSGAVVDLGIQRALRRSSRPAHWDDAITLLDVALPPRITAGSSVTATIAWLAGGPTGRSLSTAVQLNAVGGDALANADGLPAGGSYPTDRWRSGDVVLSRHVLRLGADAPAGPATLSVGWYVLTYPDGPTGSPHVTPITDDHGQPTVGVATTVVVPRADAGRGGG